METHQAGSFALRVTFAVVVVLAASTVGCSVVYTPADGGTQGANESRRFESYEARRDREQAAEGEKARAAWAPKQKAFDTAFAAELTEFHALEPTLAKDDATADTASKAEDLRARFVKRCVAESGWSTVACWNGTFARDITEALAKIRLKLGDKTSAYAELESLHYFPDLRPAEAKLHAVESHVNLEPANIAESKEMAALNPDVDSAGEDIQSITKAKDTAIIVFKVRESSSAQLSCHEELGHDGNGDLVINRPCQTTSVEVTRTVTPAVTVPLAEVDGVVAGQHGIVDFAKKGKHAGHLLYTWPDAYTKNYIRFRTTPMQAAKPGYP